MSCLSRERRRRPTLACFLALVTGAASMSVLGAVAAPAAQALAPAPASVSPLATASGLADYVPEGLPSPEPGRLVPLPANEHTETAWPNRLRKWPSHEGPAHVAVAMARHDGTYASGPVFWTSIVLRTDGSVESVEGGLPIPDLPIGERYVSIATAIDAAFLVRSDGALVVGALSDQLYDVPELPEGLDYVAVAGDDTPYALRSDGVIVPITRTGETSSTPGCQRDLTPPDGLPYKSISADGSRWAAIRADGAAVVCSGWPAAVHLPPDSFTYTGVDVAKGDVLAARSDGTVESFAFREDHEVEDAVVQVAPEGRRIVSLAAPGYERENHAVLDDGSLVSWTGASDVQVLPREGGIGYLAVGGVDGERWAIRAGEAVDLDMHLTVPTSVPYGSGWMSVSAQVGGESDGANGVVTVGEVLPDGVEPCRGSRLFWPGIRIKGGVGSETAYCSGLKSPGRHTFEARFVGPPAASRTERFDVEVLRQVTTAISLSADHLTLLQGQERVVRATLTAADGSEPAYAGAFKRNSTGAIQAEVNLAHLPPGKHTIPFDYPGAGAYAPTSVTAEVEVLPALPTRLDITIESAWEITGPTGRVDVRASAPGTEPAGTCSLHVNGRGVAGDDLPGGSNRCSMDLDRLHNELQGPGPSVLKVTFNGGNGALPVAWEGTIDVPVTGTRIVTVSAVSAVPSSEPAGPKPTPAAGSSPSPPADRVDLADVNYSDLIDFSVDLPARWRKGDLAVAAFEATTPTGVPFLPSGAVQLYDDETGRRMGWSKAYTSEVTINTVMLEPGTHRVRAEFRPRHDVPVVSMGVAEVTVLPRSGTRLEILSSTPVEQGDDGGDGGIRIRLSTTDRRPLGAGGFELRRADGRAYEVGSSTPRDPGDSVWEGTLRIYPRDSEVGDHPVVVRWMPHADQPDAFEDDHSVIWSAVTEPAEVDGIFTVKRSPTTIRADLVRAQHGSAAVIKVQVGPTGAHWFPEGRAGGIAVVRYAGVEIGRGTVSDSGSVEIPTSFASVPSGLRKLEFAYLGTARTAPSSVSYWWRINPAVITTPISRFIGSPRVGSSIAVESVSAWPAGVTVSYQWFADGTAIPGATSARLSIPVALVGKHLKVRVSASKADHEASTQVLTVNDPVAPGVFAVAAPKISGTAKIGATLSASQGLWSPAPSSLTYVWKAGTTTLKSGTSNRFVVPSTARGKRITVTVIGKRSGYTTRSAVSGATAIVAPGTFTAPRPRITGLLRVGRTITAVRGTWHPAPTSVRYVWKIGGRTYKTTTSNRLRIPAKAKGRRITVTVVGSRWGYTTKKVTSAATGVIR